jgi:hypothetical protein
MFKVNFSYNIQHKYTLDKRKNMPLPIVLWGAAAALGATGVFKGAKAVGNLKEAKEIGNDAESKYNSALSGLEKKKEKTNSTLEELGRLKLNIFTHQIKHTIDVIKKSKDAGGKLENFESSISIDELKEMEAMVLSSLKLEAGLLAGTTGGALAGFGAYSSVGLLASASTGTAISGLSGVAATNATLAWLGGGSLASGGFGMAGGMIALGGIVAGPALAIGGFMLASKAEEALTKAVDYAAQVDKAVAEIDMLGVVLKGIRKNVDEVTYTLNELVQRFEVMKVNDDSDPQAFKQMIANTKMLKDLLDCRIIDEEGSPIKNIKHTCQGFLTI